MLARVGGTCCKISMDTEGHVEVRQSGKTEVTVQTASEAARLGTLSRRRRGHVLEADTSRVLFDMAKLKRNVADSFMYHGTGNRNRMELEREVKENIFPKFVHVNF